MARASRSAGSDHVLDADGQAHRSLAYGSDSTEFFHGDERDRQKHDASGERVCTATAVTVPPRSSTRGRMVSGPCVMTRARSSERVVCV